MRRFLVFSFFIVLAAVAILPLRQVIAIRVFDTAPVAFATVDSADLGATNPRLLPSSKFYWVKDLWRQLTLAITRDSAKKAEKLVQIANDRLYEVEKMSEQKNKPDEKMLKSSLQGYLQDLKSAQGMSGLVKDEKARTELMQKISDQEFVRQRVFDAIESQTRSQVVSQFKQQSLETYAKFLFQFGADAAKKQLQNYVDKNIKFDAKSLKDAKLLEKAQGALADKNNQKTLADIREYALQKIVADVKNYNGEEQSKKISEFLKTENPPTEDLHPQSIIQMIMAEKVRLDKEFQDKTKK